MAKHNSEQNTEINIELLMSQVRESAQQRLATTGGAGPAPHEVALAPAAQQALETLVGARDLRTLGVYVRGIKLIGDRYQNIILGAQPVAGVEESGFYEPEYSEGVPVRWTNGAGRLTVPIDAQEPPRGVYIDLESTAPKGAGSTRLRVVINDHELCHEHTDEGSWSKTFSLEGMALGDHLTIELLSDSYVPEVNTVFKTQADFNHSVMRSLLAVVQHLRGIQRIFSAMESRLHEEKQEYSNADQQLREQMGRLSVIVAEIGRKTEYMLAGSGAETTTSGEFDELKTRVHNIEQAIDLLARTITPMAAEPAQVGRNGYVETCFGNSPASAPITFRIRDFESARMVTIAGSFNNWDEAALPCQRERDVWVCHTALPVGAHAYKLIVDGNWMLDPDNEMAEDDGNGNLNSLVVVEPVQQSEQLPQPQKSARTGEARAPRTRKANRKPGTRKRD
jgi:hypothetical protein